MATLVVAEHNNASLADATSKTVSAAKMLGGDVDILVAGKDASAAADAAKAIDGVRAVLHVDHDALAKQMPEAMQATIVDAL